jgi:exodeoxyribonuclease VII large subunit
MLFSQPTQMPGLKAYGLREFLCLIKEGLEEVFPEGYWVLAEIGRLNRKNGHLYLELVERDDAEGGVRAKCQAIAYRQNAGWIEERFSAATGMSLSAGIALMLKVHINLHPVYGFTLVVEALNPDYSIGQMVKKRREVLAALEKEGILGQNKTLPFPVVPLRIAVVTSRQAAGFHDFLSQLMQAEPAFPIKVVLYEALMQGRQTKASVLLALKAIALDHAKNPYDVAAIVRGGGAVADLHWFDDIDLARAVALCPIPVVLGIGHEIDKGVLDVVAHTAVKTPTEAANQILTRLFEASRAIKEAAEALSAVTKRSMSREHARLAPLPYKIQGVLLRNTRLHEAKICRLAQTLSSAASAELCQRQVRRLLDACHAFSNASKKALTASSTRLDLMRQHFLLTLPYRRDGLEREFRMLQNRVIQTSKAELGQLHALLESLEGRVALHDFGRWLKRGFTLTLDPTTKLPIVNSKEAIQKGMLLTRFADGEVLSKVVEDDHGA